MQDGTAFIPIGPYKYLVVLPFSLTSALALFQILVYDKLSAQQLRFCVFG